MRVRVRVRKVRVKPSLYDVRDFEPTCQCDQHRCDLAHCAQLFVPGLLLLLSVRFLKCEEANATFFTPAQRSMIVYDILQRVPYGDKEEQYGKGQGGMGQRYASGWAGGGAVDGIGSG